MTNTSSPNSDCIRLIRLTIVSDLRYDLSAKQAPHNKERQHHMKKIKSLAIIVAMLMLSAFVLTACITVNPPPEPPPGRPATRFSQANINAIDMLVAQGFIALASANAPSWITDAEDSFSDRILVALETADFDDDELTALLGAFVNRELLLLINDEYGALDYFIVVLEGITTAAELDNTKVVDFAFYLFVSLEDIIAAGVAAGDLDAGALESFGYVVEGGRDNFNEYGMLFLMDVMMSVATPDIPETPELPDITMPELSVEIFAEIIFAITDSVRLQLDGMATYFRFMALVSELFGDYEAAAEFLAAIDLIDSVRGPVEAALDVIDSDAAILAMFASINAEEGDYYYDAIGIVFGHALHAALNYADAPTMEQWVEIFDMLIDMYELSGYYAPDVVSDMFALADYMYGLPFNGVISDTNVGLLFEEFLVDVIEADEALSAIFWIFLWRGAGERPAPPCDYCYDMRDCLDGLCPDFGCGTDDDCLDCCDSNRGGSSTDSNDEDCCVISYGIPMPNA